MHDNSFEQSKAPGIDSVYSLYSVRHGASSACKISLSQLEYLSAEVCRAKQKPPDTSFSLCTICSKCQKHSNLKSEAWTHLGDSWQHISSGMMKSGRSIGLPIIKRQLIVWPRLVLSTAYFVMGSNKHIALTASCNKHIAVAADFCHKYPWAGASPLRHYRIWTRQSNLWECRKQCI